MLEFIFFIVSLTAEDERISLLQPNVDLNHMLTSMQNILNSGGLGVESFINRGPRGIVVLLLVAVFLHYTKISHTITFLSYTCMSLILGSLRN